MILDSIPTDYEFHALTSAAAAQRITKNCVQGNEILYAPNLGKVVELELYI